MYQNLRTLLPPSEEDTRSVHFLLFPETKKEYFNDQIERSVGRMQTVIELGRFIREQKTISLKTPIRQMVIINPDPQYHDDIKSLESYILEEMNVRSLVVTSNESAYGVNYKLVPDAKALGMKFKKDASKIRGALGQVNADEIKKFVASDKIQVAGFELTTNELQVVRTFDESKSSYHAHFTNEVLVILDTTLDNDLLQEGLAREFINRIQRLRKKAELQPTDDVLYYCSLTEDKEGQLKNMLIDQKELLTKYLKQQVIQTARNESETLIIEEEQTINGFKFLLALAKQ
jgi:isoleucyl-tRNA synthetase